MARPKISALELLKAAHERGWKMEVTSDNETIYVGGSVKGAWEAVKSVDCGGVVRFLGTDGKQVGWARLMPPGPLTCAADESIADHSAIGEEFVKMCDEAMNVNEPKDELPGYTQLMKLFHGMVDDLGRAALKCHRDGMLGQMDEIAIKATATNHNDKTVLLTVSVKFDPEPEEVEEAESGTPIKSESVNGDST